MTRAKPCVALVTDPWKRTIERVQFPKDSAGIQAFVGTTDLDHMTVMRTLDHMLCGFCDGCGYYKPDMAWSRLLFYPNPLAGRVFFYTADDHGETASMPAAIESLVRDQIEWLDAQPQLPPITVNGEIRVDFNSPDRPKTRDEAIERTLGFRPGRPRS